MPRCFLAQTAHNTLFGVSAVGNPDDFKEPKYKKKIETSGVRSIECIICKKLYSKSDILKGQYQIETLICSYCYAKMQRAPSSQSCFGKPTVMFPDGNRQYRYNINAKACREHCPDRSVCRRIVLNDDD